VDLLETFSEDSNRKKGWRQVASYYETENRVSKSELLHRRIYRLYSRNLRLGVWDGTAGGPGSQYTGGFIGIRTKFGNRFLDMEFHFEDGPPFGTAVAMEDTGVAVPESVPLECFLETLCKNCHLPAWWTGPPSPASWKCNGGCKSTSPYSKHNDELFELLEVEETKSDKNSNAE
jgi:hypothetical protein